MRKATKRIQQNAGTIVFQSTPSLRKATNCHESNVLDGGISIHTFLAEGDYRIHIVFHSTQNFNPHLPCGRRPGIPLGSLTIRIFQSTPSLRKATRFSEILHCNCHISIHTFLAEGDITYHEIPVELDSISIHTFLAEGDFLLSCHRCIRLISIHTFLAEGDSPLS